MTISSWSYSRLATFESCRHRAFLLYDQKKKEPERPLPQGKTEHANDRGTRIHTGCEEYITGVIDKMPPEAAKHFGEEMETLRNLHQTGCVSVEGEWGMSQNWEPWDWRGQWVEDTSGEAAVTKIAKALPDTGRDGDVLKVGKKVFIWVPAWLRLKLDALVFENEHEAIAIDFKSGKKFGNEVKHGEQLQLYQLVTFLRYPQLERVTTELWYLDVDDLTQRTLTRDQGLRFQRNWDRRATTLTTCQPGDFKPASNLHACRWCFFGERPGGSGDCKHGRW